MKISYGPRMALVISLLLSPAFTHAFAAHAREADADSSRISITTMSLIDLMEIEVTSASKKSQTLYKTPSAVYVLTGEDILRAGCTNVPDALRLVPGVAVARLDANKYAISIRGLTSRTSNKLLVLIDGRPIYDPLFSGVFWESRDVAPENIERIEVVRGPGGSTWGANAVNGVINIITKEAGKTLGLAVTGTSSTKKDGIGFARMGWRLTESTPVRVYVRYQDEGSGYATPEPYDTRIIRRAGLRLDHRDTGKDLSLIMNGFNADVGEGRTDTQASMVEQNGASAVANWSRKWSVKHLLSAVSFVDYFEYDGPAARETRTISQIEVRHQFTPLTRNNLIWGASFNYMSDDVWYVADDVIQPTRRADRTYSLFFENEITVVPDRLVSAFGAKFEHNDYSGYENQPSLSATWIINRRNILWGAVSRAVRIPSRLESDIVYNGIDYGDHVDSEHLVAYQLGHRAQLSDNITIDEVLFVHDYDHLFTVETDGFHNYMYGESHGAEVSLRWKATSWSRFELNYSSFHLDLGIHEGSTPEVTLKRAEQADPRNSSSMRYYLDLSRFFNLDGAFRYVDNWETLNVPSYFVADARLAWHPSELVDISLNARDLFNPHHYEQIASNTTEVEPTVFAKLSLWVR